MFRTRRELEAQLITKAARRRAAPHRDPSLFELIVGLSAFVFIVTICLSAAAWPGR